jgi:D-threo-aldose 1-dehydrogenase
MNQAPALARIVRETDVDCVLLAGRYTLLDRSGLDDLLPLCAARGVAVLAAGVFNSGILADGTTYDYWPASPEIVARTRALADVCARWNVPLPAAAVQFPARHPAVKTVLVGCRSAAEVEEDVRLFGLDPARTSGTVSDRSWDGSRPVSRANPCGQTKVHAERGILSTTTANQEVG